MNRNKLLQQIPRDKFKISKGNELIRMDKFLSFLTIETYKPDNFLGKSNGWTRRNGQDNLIIQGGCLAEGKWPNSERVEYLDRIQYKKTLITLLTTM